MYMHRIIYDVALMTIRRKTNYFHDFVQYPKQKFFAFPMPKHVLSMFLIWGICQHPVLTKKVKLDERGLKNV